MALTRNVAQILGIDNKCGSIEQGKYATLFISDGDALDVMGNDVIHAFIQGRKIDTDNRQRALYRKYKLNTGKEFSTKRYKLWYPFFLTRLKRATSRALAAPS